MSLLGRSTWMSRSKAQADSRSQRPEAGFCWELSRERWLEASGGGGGREEAKARTEFPEPGPCGSLTRKSQCPRPGPWEQQSRRFERPLPRFSLGHFCSLQLELYFVMGF